MNPCIRCYGFGIATGVALWWVAALFWSSYSDRQEALDRECDPHEHRPHVSVAAGEPVG